MVKKGLLVLALAAFAAGGVSAQEGFTGPGAAAQTGKTAGQQTTADGSKALWDNAKVVLQGRIIKAVGAKKYLFSDASGEIIVEIEKKVWRGLSVSETDTVEIAGEVERKAAGVEIEVKTIKKI